MTNSKANVYKISQKTNPFTWMKQDRITKDKLERIFLNIKTWAEENIQ